jgi:hypothetical protein
MSSSDDAVPRRRGFLQQIGLQIAMDPAVSSTLRGELLDLQETVRQLAQRPVEQYKLLETRQIPSLDISVAATLAAPQSAAIWQHYCVGEKLDDGDQMVDTHRRQFAKLIHEQGAAPHMLSYRLGDVLQSLSISTDKAGDLLLSQMSAALHLLSNQTMTKQAAPRAGLVEHQAVHVAEERDAVARADKATAAAVRRVVQRLEQMLEQAQIYAVDLVASLRRYLAAVISLANEVGVQWRASADEQAIAQEVALINPRDAIRELNRLPIYLYYDQSDPHMALTTAAIPRLHNQTLDLSYRWFWARIIQLAAEQSAGEVPIILPRHE